MISLFSLPVNTEHTLPHFVFNLSYFIMITQREKVDKTFHKKEKDAVRSGGTKFRPFRHKAPLCV